MVLVWHFVGSLWQPAYVWTIFGRTGVDLFFVLSGFLIVGILIDNRDAPNLIRTFYIRRAARILPPYLILMILYWSCYATTGPNPAFNADPSFPVQLGAQALFSYNWLMAAADGPVSRGFSVTWSVAIEEQFYLVAPFVLALVPKPRLRRVILCVGLCSALARIFFYLQFPQYGLAAYVLTPFRLDCLSAGAFVATLWRDDWAMKRLQAARLDLIFLALLCLAPLMVLGATKNIWLHMHLWGHAYLACLYATALLVVLTRGGAWLLAFPLQEAGRISYALYLFHPLFISLFFNTAQRPEQIVNLTDAGIAAGALLVSVALCYVSYYVIERPIRKVGHRARYARHEGPLVNCRTRERAG